MRLFLTVLSTILLFGLSQGQMNSDYYSRNNFLMTSAASFNDGLIGFSNPANLTLLESVENRFYWSTDDDNPGSFNNWGYFFGVPHFGLAFQRQRFGGYDVTDARISLGFGSKAHSFGIGYGWSRGDEGFKGHEKLLSVGTIMRPFKYISLGITGNFSMIRNWNEGIFEIGIRPLGTSRLTIFADAVLEKDVDVEDAPWSAGAAVKIIDGINLTGRYFENETFTVGLTFSSGFGGFGGQSHFNDKQKISNFSYYLRAGGMKKSFLPEIMDKDKKYVTFDMKGRVDYHKYVLFDDKTITLFGLLRDLRAAADDPRVAVIALNFSGMRVLPEHAWEIRQELKRAQKLGKKIIAFVDDVGMTSYHLASVADKIVLDPSGLMMLPGYAASRTFFKGTLEKLGLGFDEWRFFKYKSALENLSRDKMSAADNEQRQNYIDDLYETVRGDICQSRSLTTQQFDNIIDSTVAFLPEEAVEIGLIDTLARWSDKEAIIMHLTGRALSGMPTWQLMDNALTSDAWGEKPKIAVVYGLGVCQMDSGIRARWLEKVFLKLAGDGDIKAVVFRVDSPGGEALASDLVADALKKCARMKPVIISQGQVAGSGGYWISMYGNEILAGPNTITGSIGVIGGWLYDKGVGQKLGMTSDLVQRGAHADLGRGITLPFLGLTVPARNLTTDERAKAEEAIGKFYDNFIVKVAIGRNMSEDEVRKIGEGHFYSGIDGKEVGLVDKIGGMMSALAIAIDKAGYTPDELDVIEIPKYKGFFDMPFSVPSFSSYVGAEHNSVYKYLKMCAESNGRPLPMLTPDMYPTLE